MRVFKYHISVLKVHMGIAGDDEELDENGRVIHIEKSPLTVSWTGFDSESGIASYYIGIGTSAGDTSLTNGMLDLHQETSYSFPNLNMDVFDDSQTMYYVSVWAKNGAGSTSDFKSSNPIIVILDNVPGSVYDGFDDGTDSDIECDTRSIGMSFIGFQSVACNIEQYEWAVGSEPYTTDILPFSHFGIVLQNSSFGQAQGNIKLVEDHAYFTTVRAKTGYGCHEDYIVASSNGFLVDSTNPRIPAISAPESNTNYLQKGKNMYVQSADYIDLSWNVIDSSKISTVKWAAGTLPFLDDVHAFTETEQYRLQNGDLHLPNGETLWVYVTAEDEAGNVGSALSSPVTSDMTSPSIHNIDCNPTISKASCILLCSWEKAEELESELWALQIGIGSSGNLQDIQMYKSIHFEKQQWSKDIKEHIADFQGFEIFVHFRVSNVFDFEQSYVVKVGIDETPPDIESVLIVTTMDTSDDDTAIQQVCQLPTTYIEIALGEIVDAESDIQR